MSTQPIPPPAFPPVDHDARVAELLGRGCRIEFQSDMYTQLIRGHRINHLLHFFLGLFTLGLWWIAWFLIWITCREDRYIVPRTRVGAPR
jgi:hypothetical protein